MTELTSRERMLRTYRHQEIDRIITTKWGTTQKRFAALDSTPETLEHYYDSPEKWPEAKSKMLEYHEDRIPWDYLKENAPLWKARGDFRQLVVWFGFDVAHSHMAGTENVLIGLEMLNPLEIKAGMDPFFLKETYGDKLAFHGGINAQLWDRPELVLAEMERIIPVMKEGGGYVFASDHSIPNSVSFETMKQIAAAAHRLGRY